MSNNRSMQSAFPIVVFGTVGLSVVMSIVFLLSKGSAYDEIGQGGLGGAPSSADRASVGQAHGDRTSRSFGDRPASPTGRARAGDPPDAAGAQRTARAPGRAGAGHRRGGRQADGRARRRAHRIRGSREEVLQLVVARNERRERQGLEPLDVEAEVQRTLAELSPERRRPQPLSRGAHGRV